MTINPTKAETAVLGGGCFWCTEAIFLNLKGVLKVESGYSGGHVLNPTYKQVCTGTTGHAEVIRVEFDPEILTFSQLLEVFFLTHDPTTMNRQGADVGTQYRSAVFYTNSQQEETAREVIRLLNEEKVYKNPIVTEVSPLINYFKAEDYHQNYFERNKSQAYCAYVIQPKMDKFKKTFSGLLKK